MLIGITQTDKRLLKVINDYGCYFLCLAESSPIKFEGNAGCQKLNGIWAKANELGYITGDLNNDGDVDDAGEAEIQNPEKIANEFFNLKVKYDGKHHSAEEEVPSGVKLVIGMFFWKGSHFVVLNKRKIVIYDSFGKSNTVKNGKLKSMRYFYAD